MSMIKLALAASALVAIAVVSAEPAGARPVWYGPGSGPVSPFKNFKGFGQVPRQPGSSTMVHGGHTSNVSQPTGAYHCVPNVGLVGANGICPD